jgi:asparagine synthase (glutamine-hydrolysing)
MCGIAGYVELRPDAEPPDEAELLAPLRHRGPDSAGWHRAGPAVVGQNRLAVIDLVTGDPPITNEDGAIGVALNGEIYNFRELASALRARGHVFATAGDTEVIAHLAEDVEPVDLARALQGMFAFAVWDDRRGRLVLGRDRLGKKPLYYWRGDSRLVFASEIKGLLADRVVPRRLDPGAIPAYLTFGYVPTPRTFFDGIRAVPPGHVLVVAVDGSVELEPYWEPPCAAVTATRTDVSLEEAAGEVRSRLRAAVERRLIADVPLGAFLSGGLDSSVVVGIMSEVAREPVRTFSIGFEGGGWHDERPFARMVARRFGTQHEEFTVQPAALDLVEELVWHHDQPFGDSSAIPTYLLSRLAREHVTVALSGDGGDELFGGYERFSAALNAGWYARMPRAARELAGAGLARLPQARYVGRARRFAASAELGLPDAYVAWLSYVPAERRETLLRDPDDWAVDHYREVWAASEGAHLLDRLLDFNLRTYLLDDLLPKVDRMSMAHALEVRCPLLDTDLLAYTATLPPALKVRGLGLKRVLRAAVGDLVPRTVLRRRKHGFAVPLDAWFRGELAGYLRDMLGAPTARVRDHVVGPALDTMLAEHDAGIADHGHPLWALLTLEVFLRREGW